MSVPLISVPLRIPRAHGRTPPAVGTLTRHRPGPLSLLATGALLAAITLPGPAHAGEFVSKTYNGRKYKVYIPTAYQAGTPLPLVVMLHGCTQDPDSFAASSEMNTYGEQYRFLVAYPDQPASAQSTKCWQWYDPAHQARGKGEPADIAGITHQVGIDYSVDSSRVYMAGFSAGAATAVIMGATYPDLYAGIAVHSGLEYKAAVSLTGSSSAMMSGGPDPDLQGELAYDAMGAYARVVPTIVFHGTSDYTVYPVNGDQVLSQWAQTDDLADDDLDNEDPDDTAEPPDGVRGTVPGGRTYTTWSYRDSSSTVLLKKIKVDGMGHAWSGGSSSAAYSDAKGPEASVLLWEFLSAFTLDGGGSTGDTTPPVTSISPPAGTYTGSVTVTLTPNEPASTYYTLDGSTPTTASTKYAAPFTLTSSATVKLFSIDLAGNAEAVKSASYSVQPPSSDTTPPVTAISPPAGSYSSAVTVTLTPNEPAQTRYTLDGSTPTSASTLYTAPITLATTTTLKYFSTDQAGNAETVKSATYTITSTETEASFASIAAEDGYVGKLTADGYSTTIHKAGDKGMYNADTYRTILSFDTAPLPDSATVTSVKLRIYRQALSGTVSALKLDLVKGVFGTDATLKSTDYSATASANDVATFSAPTVNNQYVEVSLPSSAFTLINLTGRTQLRLKATTPADFAVDALTVYGGESASYRPVLVVKYR